MWLSRIPVATFVRVKISVPFIHWDALTAGTIMGHSKHSAFVELLDQLGVIYLLNCLSYTLKLQVCAAQLDPSPLLSIQELNKFLGAQ